MSALLSLALLAAPADAAAQAAPTSPNSARSSTSLSAVEVFDLAAAATRGERYDDADTLYDALGRDPDPEVRAEARFRKGMMHAQNAEYAQAATAFRALLDEKPGAARVRLELARVLAAMGDESGARRELRQAQASGLPPEVAQTVGQFSQALRSRKRFGLVVEAALAPDTNMNRATQSRTLDTVIAPLTLSDDARAQSGVGAHFSGQAYARLAVGNELSVVPKAATLATLYKGSSFDDVTASGMLGMEWQQKRDRIAPSVGTVWRWYGGQGYTRALTASLDWLHSLGKRSQLVASASASKMNNLRNNSQDGALYTLNASVERALSARTGVSVTFNGARQVADDPGYSTASGGVNLLGWREAGRTTLFASAGIQRTEGDAGLFLFGERRKEWLLNARAGATLRNLAVLGFAPYVRVTYERNAANIALYEYRRLAMQSGITRAF